MKKLVFVLMLATAPAHAQGLSFGGGGGFIAHQVSVLPLFPLTLNLP